MAERPTPAVHFALDETPTADVDRREAVTGALAAVVRDLVDATIRTDVDDDEVRAVTAEAAALVERLRVAQAPGPIGVRYNAEGRSWGWGNAVVGARNAVAPPLRIHHGDGPVWAEVTLGAAYEGPPGMVHGGVSALLLDQVMGEAAADFRRLTMTGTLSLRYLRPLPLGPVRLEARIAAEEGRKVTVEATIGVADGAGGMDGVSVEATALFIIPRWAPTDRAPDQPEAPVWRRSAEG